MNSLIFLSLILSTAFCIEMEIQLVRDVFEQWKSTHDITYATDFENELRLSIFLQNYLDVIAFNAQSDSAFLVMNKFADLTSAEFSNYYTGLVHSPGTKAETHVFQVGNLPASVDWRTQGAVTPVKNQGMCGSCWAFSATGSLEGLYFINSSVLVAFSEQNFIDCVNGTADNGCLGGSDSDALEYAAENGIEDETSYPYIANDDQDCFFDVSKAYNVSDGYYNVVPQNLTQMKAAIVSQPVSVGVQASGLAFQLYGGGVIKELCGDAIDHAVLVVGYEVVKDTEAFIVKNSWGKSWGNDGYLYISTNDKANGGDGVCGILSEPVIPYKN